MRNERNGKGTRKSFAYNRRVLDRKLRGEREKRTGRMDEIYIHTLPILFL